MVRVYEKLEEEEGVAVTYSTLTRRLRQLGISQPRKQRCHRVPDEPGLEMQHDTSPVSYTHLDVYKRQALRAGFESR